MTLKLKELVPKMSDIETPLVRVPSTAMYTHSLSKKLMPNLLSGLKKLRMLAYSEAKHTGFFYNQPYVYSTASNIHCNQYKSSQVNTYLT